MSDLLTEVEGDPIPDTPVTIPDLLIENPAKDTTVFSFGFLGRKISYTQALMTEKTDNPCDSLFTYYFTVDGTRIDARTVPGALRNQGFEFDNLCGLKMEFHHASKFGLNGVTYLRIPASLDECTGRYCHTELDHFFAIRGDSLTYLAVDGWPIRDLNHDNQIEQIIVHENPVIQPALKDRLKQLHYQDSLNSNDCVNIEVWTFNGSQWAPLVDKNNNPYFIFVHFTGSVLSHTCEVLDYNWMKPIPAI